MEDSGYINTFNRTLMTSMFERVDDYNDNIKLKFLQNRGQIGGDNIYGGWVDLSIEDGVISYNPNISSILLSESDGFASDPVRVCLCINDRINCSVSEQEMEIYGQAFNLSMVAVGQRFTPVIEFVEAKLVTRDGLDSPQGRMISQDKKIQLVQKSCTTLSYSVVMPYKEETVTLNPLKRETSLTLTSKQLQRLPGYDLLFMQTSIKVKIHDCPLGFVLHETNSPAHVRRQLCHMVCCVTVITKFIEVNNSGLVSLNSTPM